MIFMMSDVMNLHEKKRPELPCAKRADENDSWLRLMVTNPMNGIMSTFSNDIVELGRQENDQRDADSRWPEPESL
jgi:hypothetical protein